MSSIHSCKSNNLSLNLQDILEDLFVNDLVMLTYVLNSITTIDLYRNVCCFVVVFWNRFHTLYTVSVFYLLITAWLINITKTIVIGFKLFLVIHLNLIGIIATKRTQKSPDICRSFLDRIIKTFMTSIVEINYLINWEGVLIRRMFFDGFQIFLDLLFQITRPYFRC